jgi:hypothetical protein
VKVCKDGRIWGQNNKEAGCHLGVSMGKKTINGQYVKKGYSPNSIPPKGKDSPIYGTFGKDSRNWRGGITPLSECIRKMLEYKLWRHQVFVRDGFACVECHQVGKRLNVHHIKSFVRMLKENHITTIWEAQMCKELWDVNNGVSLCKECHKLTKNYGGKRC